MPRHRLPRRRVQSHPAVAAVRWRRITDDPLLTLFGRVVCGPSEDQRVIFGRSGRSAVPDVVTVTQDVRLSEGYWYPLFPNPVVAESLLDRLINTSHQIFMNGPSYRPNKNPANPTRQPLHRTSRKITRGLAPGNYVSSKPGNSVSADTRGSDRPTDARVSRDRSSHPVDRLVTSFAFGKRSGACSQSAPTGKGSAHARPFRSPRSRSPSSGGI